MTECPHCHQTMPEIRLGVRLSRLKAAIFDVIWKRGEHRVTQQELQGLFELSSLFTVRTHIWGINELIEDEGWRIKGGTKHDPGYKFVQLKKHLPKAHVGVVNRVYPKQRAGWRRLQIDVE